LRCAIHSAAAIALLKKSIFNLSVDAMEPSLSPLGSFLISSDLRFQLRNPIFGRAQLMREALRRLQRVSAVFFRNTGRSVEHLQDRLACFVELIGAVRCRGSFSPLEWDHIRLGVVTPNLTMHHSALPLDSTTISSIECFDCGVLRLLHGFHRSNVIRLDLLKGRPKVLPNREILTPALALRARSTNP
jgi:hypothetical protein